MSGLAPIWSISGAGCLTGSTHRVVGTLRNDEENPWVVDPWEIILYLSCGFLSRGMRNQISRWNDTYRRNRNETDQVHVLEVYESFANLPLLMGESVHGVALKSSCKPRTTGGSEAM